MRLFFLPITLVVASGALLMAGTTAVPVLEYAAAQAVAGEVPAAIVVDKRRDAYITGTTITPQSAPRPNRVEQRKRNRNKVMEALRQTLRR